MYSYSPPSMLVFYVPALDKPRGTVLYEAVFMRKSLWNFWLLSDGRKFLESSPPTEIVSPAPLKSHEQRE